MSVTTIQEVGHAHPTAAAAPVTWPRWVTPVFAALVIFDLGKRLGCIAIGPGLIAYDSDTYWRMGGYFLRGDWQPLYPLLSWRTPGYPILIAAVMWVFGDNALLALVCLQHALSFATSLLAAWVAYTQTGSAKCALVTYACGALALSNCLYANLVLTEVWFAFLLVGHYAFLVYACRTGRLGALGGAGVLAGCCMLVRPVAQLLLAPEILWLCFLRTWSLRRRALMMVVVSSACAVTVAPWFLRNAWVYQRTPFLSQFLGRALWIACYSSGPGHLERSVPAEDEVRVRDIMRQDGDLSTDHEAFAMHGILCEQGLSVIDADRQMVQVCKESIRRAPGTFALGFLSRVWRYHWEGAFFTMPGSSDKRWTGSQPALGLHPWRWAALADLFDLLVARLYPPRVRTWGDRAFEAAFLILTLLALKKTPGRLWVALPLLIVLYFTAVGSAVNVPVYRFRMPTEPLMSIGIGVGLRALLGRAYQAIALVGTPVEQG